MARRTGLLALAAALGVCLAPRPADAQVENVPPVVETLTVTPSQVAAGRAASIACTASDLDGAIVSFDVQVTGGTLPNGATTQSFPVGTPTTPASITVSWTAPAVVEVATHGVTCTATDSASATGQATAAVTVTGPPVIDAVSAPSEPILTGETVTLAVAAHDPAGTALTYTWATTTGGTLSPAGETATFTAVRVAGVYNVSVTVRNEAGQTASTIIPVKVLLSRHSGGLATFSAPQRITATPDGALYVVDGRRGEVFPLTRRGEAMGVFSFEERAVAVASSPSGLLVSTAQGNLLTVDPANGKVIRSLPLGVPAGPVALAYDATRGLLWMAERDLNRVRAIQPDGTTAYLLTAASLTPLNAPSALAIDPVNGRLWVALESNEKGSVAHAFTLDGVYVRSALTFGSGTGKITRVGGAAVDAAGRLYVSDIFQGLVQAVGADGVALGAIGEFGAGAGQLTNPSDVAVLANGDLVVLNLDAARTERFGVGVPLPVCAGDTDCDGLPDDWETRYGLDPSWPGDALLDSDGDGLTNLEEQRLGTDPRNADTDGDGVSDREELEAGFDPTNPADHSVVSLTATNPPPTGPGLVRLNATLTSSTACSVAWSQLSGPAGVTLVDGETLAPWFIGRAAGTYEFRAVASCGTAGTFPATAQVTIRNVAPTPDPGRIVVVAPGQTVRLDGSFSRDANADPFSLVWDQTLGAAVVASTQGDEVSFSVASPSRLEFLLTATDAAGATSYKPVTVLVTDALAGTPHLVVSSPVSGVAGAAVTLDATGSSVPRGNATYAWSQVSGPAATLSGASTALASFVPGSPGRYVFEVSVSDGELSPPPERVEVYVSAAGTLPTAAASAPATAAVGAPVRLDGRGSAPASASGGTLAFRWNQVSGPAAGLTDATDAVATFVPFEAGTYVFELSVSEGAAVAIPVRVRIDASATGAALPVASATGPGTAYTGSLIQLDGSGSVHPGGAPLRYRWTQIAGPWVALDDARSVTPRFVTVQPGAYVFELEVDDGAVRSAPATITVLVFELTTARQLGDVVASWRTVLP